MRHSNARRNNRHRHQNQHQRKYQNPRTMVYDSNGPEVRIRGTAPQIVEKYLALAKDSSSSGDRVLAENYLQHAEHYQRIITSWDEENGTGQNGMNGHQQHNRRAQDGENPDIQPSESDFETKAQPAYPPSAFNDRKAVSEDEDLGLPASLIGRPLRVHEPADEDE